MATQTIDKTIYNGLYQIKHNPNAKGRTPRYLVNGEPKPGVTTILGETLAKDLMQWAADMASAHWFEDVVKTGSAHLKYTGEQLIELKMNAAKAYTVKRDSGASTGTEAHELVELMLKGQLGDLGAKLKKASSQAKKAYQAFYDWFVKVKPEVLGVEEVVYSPTFDYCGTYDCLLKIKDKTYLCDFKTTNASQKAPKGIYPEMFLQLGAYLNAYKEQRDYELGRGGTKLHEVDGVMVISGKKNGQLDILTNEDVGQDNYSCMLTFNYVLAVHAFMRDAGVKVKEARSGV